MWSQNALGGFFHFGFSGVDFFFVLSGFIMYQVHCGDFGKPSRIPNYLLRRFVRIYPLFWLILVVTSILLMLSKDSAGGEYVTPLNFVFSALLAGPDPWKAIVSTSWTLWHEVLFYALFAVVIARPRLGAVVLAFWTAAGVVLTILHVSPPWPEYLTTFVNLLFLFGIFCAWLLNRARIPAPRAVLGLGVASFVATGILVDYVGLPSTLYIFLFGISSLAILLGLVQGERDGVIAVPRPLVQLGAASFALYLTHPITIAALARVLRAIHAPAYVPADVGLAVFVAGGIAGGVIVHLTIERPLTHYLNHRLAVRRARLPLSVGT